jgi:hypothetical protein
LEFRLQAVRGIYHALPRKRGIPNPMSACFGAMSGCAQFNFLLAFWLGIELLLIKIAAPSFTPFQMRELSFFELFLKVPVFLVSGANLRAK